MGIVVLRGDEVLLVRRSREPGRGRWALPGGAQRVGETVEEAGRRELREEAGLEVGALRFVGYVDAVHRDAEGRVRFHYTMLDLAAAWQGGAPACGDDADAAEFVAVAELAAREVGAETLRMVEAAGRLLGGEASEAGLCPNPPKAAGLWKPAL